MNGNPNYSDPVDSAFQNRSKRLGWATRLPVLGLGPVAAIVCGLTVMSSGPAMAQSHSFAVKTEQGESLQCKPATPASAICERGATATSSVQSLDGATDMLIKLIYLGLPGAVLVGISFRTLHLHRQLMRQRAFVESLERIWDRTVSY